MWLIYVQNEMKNNFGSRSKDTQLGRHRQAQAGVKNVKNLLSHRPTNYQV